MDGFEEILNDATERCQPSIFYCHGMAPIQFIENVFIATNFIISCGSGGQQKHCTGLMERLINAIIRTFRMKSRTPLLHRLFFVGDKADMPPGGKGNE